MKRPKFTEEQIIGILREQEAGAKTAEVCRLPDLLTSGLLSTDLNSAGTRHRR